MAADLQFVVTADLLTPPAATVNENRYGSLFSSPVNNLRCGWCKLIMRGG